ncbi:MAG TPA: hypothetical protein VHE55_17900 [Fimbriimonadaceae bacterium]|nr:hypothetical protein [Fimbriimonadaceae bacterium]
MRPIALLLSLAMGASALASNAPDWLVGSYKLELTPDLKAAVQKLGMPEPYARIMLRDDGTFSYAANNGGNVSGANGTYEFADHKIKLTAANLFPAQNVKSLSGKAGDDGLEIDGLHYVKVKVDSDRSIAPSPVRTLKTFDVVGTWYVQSGDRPDKSIKMVFKDNHTFEFAGMAASSKGRFDLDGDKLTLTWTEVDGEAVEPGAMHKVIYLHEDGSFNIDTYRYQKN